MSWLANNRIEDARHDDDGDGDVVIERAPKVGRARRYGVVFYNDDYTTKWFVVHVLEQFFHMNETTASEFMMAVHRQGKGVAGVYTRDIAETKAAAVTEYAREFEMPLKVTAEPEDGGDD
ncbi:ATP-dependent Clp protease adaptor protein ClpS [Labilithrix luteola]|uniref:ATP-dependent Clp protease adapter protein ClpS n=1 Tax=Labilithrix luteola TaxID=1391654 RepID=A0A0K1PQ10_9BACT|nr:ATP-dependent Clp protease adaptor ClpS [Labilithrix luteola]AKU95613.1 ATP-dependent Clp protease adaptor protein ClpS [Labilithrix luteola]